jgi:transposase
LVEVVRQKPCPTTAIHLQVKTLLRRVQDFAGFIIKSVRLTGEAKASVIEVQLDADPRFKRRCSCCGGPGRVHDILPERSWDFVPLWGIAVKLRYAPRRVACAQVGPTVEIMPWNKGKSPYAKAYMIYLARWARRLSWKETSEIFGASWDAVRRSVTWVVQWGLENRELQGVSAVGVDEMHWGRGKKSANFVTLIYQIDAGMRRLLWVGHRRRQSTLKAGFNELEKNHEGFLAGLRVVCSDMWRPYLKVIAEMAGAALNVLDPFHVAQHLNAAVDTVRRGEQSRLKSPKARKDAKGGRFLLLRRGTKVRGRARAKLQAVLRSLRATSRAWELKESFRKFWAYRSETWAAAYLKAWTTRAMRSRLEPMKRVARMLRRHEDLLLNYFRAKRKYNSAVVEGLNNKARVSLARSFGHRSFEVLQLVLYHNLGKLPEPPSPHKFC